MADRRPASGFDALRSELPDDLTPHTGGLDGIVEIDPVPCKVCGGIGIVGPDEWGNFAACPRTYRPCDLSADVQEDHCE